jgi:hypothetical protein
VSFMRGPPEPDSTQAPLYETGKADDSGCSHAEGYL